MDFVECCKQLYMSKQNMIKINCLISAVVLTGIMTLNYSVTIIYNGYTADFYVVRPRYVIIAILIAIPIYVILIYKKNVIDGIINSISNKVLCVSLFFSVSVIVKLILDTKKNYGNIKESSLGRIVSLGVIDDFHDIWITVGCTYCGVAILVINLLLCVVAKEIICEYFFPLESYEIKYIIVTFTICVFCIFYYYQRATGQWNSLDLVYQTDTVFLYEHYYPVFSYGYDFDWDIGNGGIRHPLATLVTFPIYIIVCILSNFLFFIPNVDAILYAVSNAILLVLIVLMLVRITNNKWLFLIFTVSYPFSFYTIFLEKYQLAVFFSVLFLYLVKRNAELKYQALSLITAGGVMITSALCGFGYGKQSQILKRLKEYISIFVVFLIVIILSGRISYLMNFVYLKNQNYQQFYNFENITIYERICKYTNTIVSCFVPVPYRANEKNFFWTDYNTNFNLWSVIILILIFVAFISNYRKIEVKIFSLWIGWSFLQLLLASIFPLFNLYFAWAVIPMALLGMETIVKNKKIKTTIYVMLATVMIYSNYHHMVDILDYLVLKTPM